ncbi:MAG: hypothetical protein SFX73_27130 [Kofleriaceae bacterium]|nr:hypothetical protein [Kofleriaceae bacterium]
MEELVALYRSRVARFEREAYAPRSLAAARALLDAAMRATTPEVFHQYDLAGHLSLNAAIARVADSEERRAVHWDALGETVRAAPHHEVLRALASTPPASEDALVSLVSRIHQQANLRIVADEELRERAWSNREALDEHEVVERGEVPPAWRSEQARSLARKVDEIRALFRAADANLAAFVPGWRPPWEVLDAPRHRLRLAWSDGERVERIRRFHAIVGGA